MDVRICVPPKPGHDVRDWINDMRSQGATRGEIFAAMEANCKPAGEFVAARREVREKEASEKSEADDDRAEILKALKIRVLTKDAKGKVEVYSEGTKQRQEIPDIGRLSYPRLISICGGKLVRRHVQEGSEDSHKTTLRDVRIAIADASGLKNESSVIYRGSGIWKCDDELVICDRESCCIWDGKKLNDNPVPIHKDYFYESHLPGSWFDPGEFLKLSPDPIETIEECKELVGRWRWDCSDAPEAVTGLILATWVQLIWNWRPQIVITGKKNSGKSIFFQMLENLFGGLSDNQSDSTLSGIVSSIENSGVIVLLDELDSNPERPKIFTLIKRAGRGAKRRTGTAQQKSIVTTARQMFWCAGIDSGLERDTEAERFVKLDLLGKAAGSERIRPSELLCHDLGQRLLKLAILHGQNASRAAVRLAGEVIPPIPDRVVETYSVPAAMLAEVTGQPGREILVRILENEAQKKTDSQSDEDALRDAVLGAHVTVGQGIGSLSVGQLIERATESLTESFTVPDDDVNFSALKKVGIEISDSEIRISHTQVSRHLLQKTSFRHRSVKEIFLRMGFSEGKIKSWRFLRKNLDEFLE